MPDPSPTATEDADSLEARERALLDRQLEALDRLAAMAMAIAAAITQRATADEPSDAVIHHAAMDFARVSRAVRMTFALQSRLIAEFKGVTRPGEAAPAGDGPIEVRWANADLSDEEEVQKRQVRGIVERLAEAQSLDREAVERLAGEAGERLEGDTLHHDLTRRPLGEVVALICKDLGLEPDWDLLAGAYWAEIRNPQEPAGLALRRLEDQANPPPAARPERVTTSPACGRGGPSAAEPMVERARGR